MPEIKESKITARALSLTDAGSSNLQKSVNARHIASSAGVPVSLVTSAFKQASGEENPVNSAKGNKFNHSLKDIAKLSSYLTSKREGLPPGAGKQAVFAAEERLGSAMDARQGKKSYTNSSVEKSYGTRFVNQSLVNDSRPRSLLAKAGSAMHAGITAPAARGAMRGALVAGQGVAKGAIKAKDGIVAGAKNLQEGAKIAGKEIKHAAQSANKNIAVPRISVTIKDGTMAVKAGTPRGERYNLLGKAYAILENTSAPQKEETLRVWAKTQGTQYVANTLGVPTSDVPYVKTNFTESVLGQGLKQLAASTAFEDNANRNLDSLRDLAVQSPAVKPQRGVANKISSNVRSFLKGRRNNPQ
jgi:hypothetical protein